MYLLRSVILEELLVLPKINGFRFIFELEMVLGTIADVGFSLMKGYVLFYKILINPLVADDLITDGIGHGQICLGLEED